MCYILWSFTFVSFIDGSDRTSLEEENAQIIRDLGAALRGEEGDDDAAHEPVANTRDVTVETRITRNRYTFQCRFKNDPAIECGLYFGRNVEFLPRDAIWRFK